MYLTGQQEYSELQLHTKVHFRGNILLTSFHLLQERYNVEGNYGFLHGLQTSRSYIRACMCVCMHLHTYMTTSCFLWFLKDHKNMSAYRITHSCSYRPWSINNKSKIYHGTCIVVYNGSNGSIYTLFSRSIHVTKHNAFDTMTQCVDHLSTKCPESFIFPLVTKREIPSQCNEHENFTQNLILRLMENRKIKIYKMNGIYYILRP